MTVEREFPIDGRDIHPALARPWALAQPLLYWFTAFVCSSIPFESWITKSRPAMFLSNKLGLRAA